MAPNHPVIKEQKAIDKVEFVQQGIDNEVVGKYKRGGQKLKPSTVVCRIHCKDETIYTVCACMKASLIEINKRLINHPEWILTHVSII